MLCGSETWCLMEKELAILRKTERAMIRTISGVKLMERKNIDDLMDMLGLDETMNKKAKDNGVRWCEHVSKKEDHDILRKASEFKLDGQKKRGRSKMTRRT